MRRIFFTYETGYCGSTGHDCIEYPDDVTDDELDQDAYYQAIDHASSYGFEICDCDEYDCEKEHEGMTAIGGSWEDYVPEKHDQLRPGGGCWFEN